MFGSFEYIYIQNLNIDTFKPYENKAITISGYIESEPTIKIQKISYILKTVSISYSGENKLVQGRILLSTNNNKFLEYGSNIKVSGTLRVPKGQTNFMGFDYKMYLAQSGVYATLFSTSDKIVLSAWSGGSPFVKAGLFVRNKILDVIDKCLPPNQAGLLNGVLIGYTKDLSDDIQKNFSKAGLTHVMAVSGANVAFIMFPLMFVFSKLRFSKKLSSILMILILIFFTYITGFQPSVLRAVVMAVTVLIGNLLRRDADVLSSIAFSSILLLSYNPMSLFNIGFQLSYVATLSLILLSDKVVSVLNLDKLPKSLKDIVSCTISAQIGVLPIIT
jgi:competence protein ComEC